MAETFDADLLIVGGGAAGMAAAIFAGRASQRRHRIVVLEGARKPGAKILVSGGGRCNVTNAEVTPSDFWGGPPPIVRKVLRAFDEKATLEWMHSMGVELKLEPTGKYFPQSDQARSVLSALLDEMQRLHVDFRTGARVRTIAAKEGRFTAVLADESALTAPRLIVATGGLALPKSGSDGAGLGWLRRLGHTIIPTTPALAPLVLVASEQPGGRFAELSGLTLDLRLRLAASSGKLLREQCGSTLFTHFGVSGPAPMNFSRHLLRHRLESGEEGIVTIGHPMFATVDDADAWLQDAAAASPKKLAVNAVLELHPERLARLLAGEFPRLGDLTRAQRRELATRLARLPIQVKGDRGYSFAETTAGGVSLRDINAATMESRIVPGLHLCGEVLDVDGRIGGFNFQWAWASGHLAGRGAVAALEGASQA